MEKVTSAPLTHWVGCPASLAHLQLPQASRFPSEQVKLVDSPAIGNPAWFLFISTVFGKGYIKPRTPVLIPSSHSVSVLSFFFFF